MKGKPGHKHSQETLDKIRLKRKGKKNKATSQETKDKLSAVMEDNPLTRKRCDGCYHAGLKCRKARDSESCTRCVKLGLACNREQILQRQALAKAGKKKKEG